MWKSPVIMMVGTYIAVGVANCRNENALPAVVASSVMVMYGDAPTRRPPSPLSAPFSGPHEWWYGLIPAVDTGHPMAFLILICSC